MRAVLFDAPHEARMVQVPEPTVPSGWVLVRTRLTGICGSDMHAYLGTQPFFVYPQIPGHEAIGEVMVAADNCALEKGQRVVLDPTVNCGHCRPCRLGRYNCCANIRVIGVHAPGTMAEMFAAPAERLHPVPESVPDEVAVLAEPLSIALHATHRAGLLGGEQIAIIGAGAIGLSVLLMAKTKGASCAVCDLQPSRLYLARQLGADLTLNPAEVDVATEVREWTGGQGAAVAFEAVGRPATIRLAVELAGSAGRVVILGLCHEDVLLPGSMFVRKELEVVGSRLHCDTVQRVVGMLSRGEVSPRPLLTEVRPLSEYQSALDDLRKQPERFVKVALCCRS